MLRSAIAASICLNSVPLLHNHFAMEGVLSTKTIPLGGSSVLLNFESKEIMDGFLSDGAWLKKWFSDIKPCKSFFSLKIKLD